MAGSLSNLLYHIIFSTKHREPLLTAPFAGRIHAYMGGIIGEHRGTLLRIGGTADHVHMVVKLKPDTAPSDTVRVVKANTSKWLNALDEYPGHFEWQRGYGAFTVSQSQLGPLIAYVENQAEHHRYVSFQEEYRAFLTRHEIDFDERYLWD